MLRLDPHALRQEEQEQEMPYVLERFHDLEVIGQTQSEVPKPHSHVEGEVGAVQ